MLSTPTSANDAEDEERAKLDEVLLAERSGTPCGLGPGRSLAPFTGTHRLSPYPSFFPTQDLAILPGPAFSALAGAFLTEDFVLTHIKTTHLHFGC